MPSVYKSPPKAGEAQGSPARAHAPQRPPRPDAPDRQLTMVLIATSSA
jgi:hypothetical protein